ncbi:hypothetical protein CLV78_111122 [Aliiruegeria haliotis]|uniref:Uncharacterized protein n=1 Tax=Aliiruegeria haliotis TaxID=1280846 RepID=A0A2T0RIL3_9RHOB|nr:hypothetical protein CLV78_111122 [Aliiruegeria haliotis]
MIRPIAFSAFVLPSAAIAHSGDHGGMSLATEARHILSSPLHLALVGAGGLLLVLIVRGLVKRTSDVGAVRKTARK